MYIFEVVIIFLAQWLSNQSNFSVAVHIYKIDVFEEAFFLLAIRMVMATKRFRVVTCCEEFSHINMHNTSTKQSCGVT